MTAPITVQELLYLCKKELLEGNGDKEVWMAKDEEGNDFPPLVFGFNSDIDTITKIDIYCDPGFNSPQDTIILG